MILTTISFFLFNLRFHSKIAKIFTNLNISVKLTIFLQSSISISLHFSKINYLSTNNINYSQNEIKANDSLLQ